MTQEVYVAHILEPIVSKWCENKEEEWVLEEDNDSGYRVKDNGNVVEQWKANHGMSRT